MLPPPPTSTLFPYTSSSDLTSRGRPLFASSMTLTIAVLPAVDPSRESGDRKSTRLNSSHANISYAVFCLKKKKVRKFKVVKFTVHILDSAYLLDVYDIARLR